MSILILIFHLCFFVCQIPNTSLFMQFHIVLSLPFVHWYKKDKLPAIHHCWHGLPLFQKIDFLRNKQLPLSESHQNLYYQIMYIFAFFFLLYAIITAFTKFWTHYEKDTAPRKERCIVFSSYSASVHYLLLRLFLRFLTTSLRLWWLLLPFQQAWW